MSKKKKVLPAIALIVVLGILSVSPLKECNYIEEQSITKNITVPISKCDVMPGGTIDCYSSTREKEIVETINVTINTSCSLVNYGGKK